MQKQFHSQTKDDLNHKLNKELKISEYENDAFDKFTFEKLDRNLTIIEKGEKSFKFLSSGADISENYNKITSIVKSVSVLA